MQATGNVDEKQLYYYEVYFFSTAGKLANQIFAGYFGDNFFFNLLHLISIGIIIAKFIFLKIIIFRLINDCIFNKFLIIITSSQYL